MVSTYSVGVEETSGDLSIQRLFRMPLTAMLTPVSHLTKLPVEILEQIFVQLPGQDVIKMGMVRGVVSSFVRCGFDTIYPA